MHSENVDYIVKKITSLSVYLGEAADLDMSRAEVRKAHDSILAILDQSPDTDEQDAIFSAVQATPLHFELLKINAALHVATEKAQAREFVGGGKGHDPLNGSWITEGFEKILQGQVKNWKDAGATFNRQRSRIIIVGGGALPQTQISFFRQLQCDVCAIEKDPESAELARQVLKKVGYGHLHVENCDGSEFDYKNADLVVAATLVDEKEMVGKRVAETNKTAYFAPREPVGLHKLWRTAIRQDILRDYGWSLVTVFEPAGAAIRSLTFRQ